MSFFASAAEVDCYVGGALRLAAVDPRLGPALAGADLILRFVCTDVPARLTVVFAEPITVTSGDAARPDVELLCSGAFLDAYMRGERRLVDALACGEVIAHGRVSRVLKCLPDIEQSFPYYRELVALAPRTTSRTSGAIS